MKFVPNSVSRAVVGQAMKVSKNSPKLLFVAGIAGFGATIVLASKATLRLDDEVLTPAQKKFSAIKAADAVQTGYSENDVLHDKALVYFQSAVAVGKLYAPAIVVGGLSVLALTKSHNILTKRNAALTAAYAALEAGFLEYRKRVVAEYGEEKDKELRYGVSEREIVEETKNGPKVSKIKGFGTGGSSIYARLFHEGNQNWVVNPELNVFFLRMQQNYLNDRLHARGHVFLNEAYDQLGMERTREGSVVGWRLGNNSGDGVIDFGIWSDHNRNAFVDFATGREGEILIDFNVDGTIWDKI